MSVGQQAIQQASTTWTEPPWSGWIETTGDALRILEAARRGVIPRVTRRLVESERKMITSGSVFVFDEDESGIKRWTDGFFWSPSRILGNFLLYRETDKRGHRNARDEIDEVDNTDGGNGDNQLSRPRGDGMGGPLDKQRERNLVGSLTNSYKFKPNGLMKKTFSVTVGNVAQHLVSYYKVEDVESGRLRSPSEFPELASLDISPEYLDKTHFRNPPQVEIGVDGVPRYKGEAENIESASGPLSRLPQSPVLVSRTTEIPSSKRTHRFEPYGSPPLSKGSRRNTKSSQSDEAATPTGESRSPQMSASPQPGDPAVVQPATTPIYPDPNLAQNMATQPHPLPPAPYPTYGMPAFYPGYTHPPPGHMYAPGPPPQVGVPYPPPPPPGSGPITSSAPPLAPQPGMPYATYPSYLPPPIPPPHPAIPQQQQAPQQSAQQVHGSDPSQAGHAAPQHHSQPYYSYYPPLPPPGYPPYPGQWPMYSGYPPPPQPVHSTTVTAVAPAQPAMNLVKTNEVAEGQVDTAGGGT